MSGIQASHPSRGAWIEMCCPRRTDTRRRSRTPHGVRGLKYSYIRHICYFLRRTPHGVRGLKFELLQIAAGDGYVAPLTGCVD